MAPFVMPTRSDMPPIVKHVWMATASLATTFEVSEEGADGAALRAFLMQDRETEDVDQSAKYNTAIEDLVNLVNHLVVTGKLNAPVVKVTAPHVADGSRQRKNLIEMLSGFPAGGIMQTWCDRTALTVERYAGDMSPGAVTDCIRKQLPLGMQKQMESDDAIHSAETPEDLFEALMALFPAAMLRRRRFWQTCARARERRPPPMWAG